MHGLTYDIAHLLAGSLVLVSFMLLYQDRLYALLNVYALHALVLAAAVAWQAYAQGAPHLYITAAIALLFKAIVIPVALHRMIVKLGIHREIETVGGIGLTMLLGMGLVALAMVVTLRATEGADLLAREDLAFALSVVLLGLLMMVTRQNAVSQVVGFMSLENGLVLAATGAKGMPLVVEISVAFSILIAFIVIGIFLFRIRERFDTVDVGRWTVIGESTDEPRSGDAAARDPRCRGAADCPAAWQQSQRHAQCRRLFPDLLSRPCGCSGSSGRLPAPICWSMSSAPSSSC